MYDISFKVLAIEGICVGFEPDDVVEGGGNLAGEIGENDAGGLREGFDVDVGVREDGEVVFEEEEGFGELAVGVVDEELFETEEDKAVCIVLIYCVVGSDEGHGML